jgi:hypothetical protein
MINKYLLKIITSDIIRYLREDYKVLIVYSITLEPIKI